MNYQYIISFMFVNIAKKMKKDMDFMYIFVLCLIVCFITCH